MPEPPSSSQLRDLVEKHEKSARDAVAVPELRTDKPKAKFRRSFILEEEDIGEPQPESARSPSAPVSLKSLWLHGNEVKLGSVGRGKSVEDTSSHSTVVSSRTSMQTDSTGKVSVTRDTMAGEISVVDDEAPKGKLVKSEFKFNKAGAEDKGRSEAKTTTAILNARNIKDSQITESFRLTDHNGRVNNFIENEKKGSHRKTESSSNFKENQESGVDKRKKSDTNQAYAEEKKLSKTDSSSSFSSKQFNETSEKRSSLKKTDSSASVKSRQHAVNEDDEAGQGEVRRKPVVRGDSVRALQNKFQQATVSSSMKTAVPSSNESKAVSTSNNQTTRSVISNGTTSTTTTTKSSSTRTETFSTVTKSSSFADSEEEDDSGDGTRQTIIEEEDIGNSSAALVSRVEKQRVATSESRTESRQKLDLSEVDLISDESQLRILLDACSDYEGRRKIRARLRDVMAENNDSSTMGTRGVYLGDDSDEDDVKVVNDSGTESSEDQNENNRTVVDKHFKNGNEDKALMTEVQITLARLENELNKTNNKDNVQGLMNKLKTFLNVKNVNENIQQVGQTIPTPPPRKYHKHRHSIAVSQNDMTVPDQHNHQEDRTVTVGKFNQPKVILNSNPNRQNDVQLKQAVNLNNSSNKSKNVVHFQKDILDSNRTNNDVGKQCLSKENSLEVQSRNLQFQKQSSLDSSDYSSSLISPRLVLSSEAARIENMNPHVKPYNNAHYNPDVHNLEPHEPDKPLVATLTLRENNQSIDDADDGDISSDDDDLGGNNIRNARKLLKFAKIEMKSKQLVRSSKKIKMKRSNTIDIPKNMKYYSSGDELANEDRLKTKTPTFIPKTENDFKFLAFLKRNNTEDTKTYNSAARGGAHWSNRFSCIKTTFENAEKQNGNIVEPKKSKAKLFWQKSEEKMNQNNRIPWKINEEDSTNVITGSLVVQTKPTQNFTHAIKSPFQAVNKIQSIPQTKTSYSGTVKQMANEKFNKTENVQHIGPRVVVGVKNPKVSNIDQQMYNYENSNSQVRRPETQNAFSPTNSTHHNFTPEQTNFKPIPIKSDVSHTYKPIVQPVYPYQKPQVSNQLNNQPNQFVKKQFPEPQYQKPVPKVLSPQYGINAFKENSMYEPPLDFQDKSRIFSPNQNRAGFNDNPCNFQVQNDPQSGYYENQISPYEPSVVEIHKSPLCTKNGSHFTPISPAVVDGISYEPQTVAVSRVMGKEQCQQAVIVNKSDRQHFNESTNVLKNIISQNQNYDNPVPVSFPPQSQLPEKTSTYPFTTSDLPSNTSYVYPTPVNHTNVTLQPMNYTANSSVPQTFHNFPQSTKSNSSYQSFASPPTSISNLHHTSQGMVQQDQYYPLPAQTNYQSIPQNSLHQTSNAIKTRPNSMYMHSDEYNNKVGFSNNPIYSTSNAPYALSGSKSSSSVYPSSLMSPVNYSYRNNSSNVPQERSYQSIPSNQFVDPRQRLVSNNVTSYERAISQPPSPRHNSAIINNVPSNTPRTNFKGPGGETKISYMNYISQISPQTMQSKLNYSPGRKSISPSGQNSQSFGELSQSSTQSSISENSPIKLISPHMNLSTPSSPQFPNPPILTKTPQLKISSKTAFVPVKPFNQNIASSSTPKQNLKLPPTSPHASYNISPSASYLSPMSPSSSPKMPSVLQKSESWHQMVLDRMGPKKLSPIPVGPNKLLPKAKSSHSLNFAKQFEAAIPDTIEKKKTVEAYLKSEGNKKEINKYNFKQFKKTKTCKSSSSIAKTVVPLSDNLDNVDEAFDSLFNSSK